MKKVPKVSVIIPSYNAGKFLSQAIESVVNQTYKNLEIIIVNDGSTDNTEKTVKEWQSKDERIKYYAHDNNRGLPAARNTGIKHSRGEYIALLDADDIWLPRKIEIQLNKLLRVGADVVFTNWYIWDPGKGSKEKAFDFNPAEKYQRNILNFLIKKNFGNSSTVLFRAQILKKTGLFDESLKSSEDYDLWLRFIIKDMKIIFCLEPLIYCRVHSGQMTENTYKMRTSRLKVFKKIIQRHPWYLIKYPNLFKKIILLQGYKCVQDFLKVGNKKR